MENNPMNLLFKRDPESLSIFLYPVNANINFSPNAGRIIIRQVKSYDICINIMFKVLLIDLEEIVIGTKDKLQLRQFRAFFFKEGWQEPFQGLPVMKWSRLKKMKENAVFKRMNHFSKIVSFFINTKLHLLKEGKQTDYS